MTDITFNYCLEGQLYAPEGSKLNATGSGVILPDGREIKLWEQLEINTPGEDDHENLSMDELQDMNLWFDGDVCRIEEA